MDIPINAKVSCSDGLFGQSTHVILMPTTEKITHVVVVNGLYPDTGYMVPVNRIVESTPDQIQLSCTRAELFKMPVFNQVEFLPTSMTASVNPYMMWPAYYAPNAVSFRVERDTIPVDELAIRRGAKVEATDGKIGRVDEFLVNPESDAITHLVMREGHLWGQKDVSIPVSQIDHYKENTVFLKLDKHAIEALPTLPIHRGSTKK